MTYRIWQIGFRRDSTTLLATGRTFRTQVEGALTPVDGDCQYVLFNVTVPPQIVMKSVLKNVNFIISAGFLNNFDRLTDATDFSKGAGTARTSTK
jgi:hypothetical protein